LKGELGSSGGNGRTKVDRDQRAGQNAGVGCQCGGKKQKPKISSKWLLQGEDSKKKKKSPKGSWCFTEEMTGNGIKIGGERKGFLDWAKWGWESRMNQQRKSLKAERLIFGTKGVLVLRVEREGFGALKTIDKTDREF